MMNKPLIEPLVAKVHPTDSTTNNSNSLSHSTHLTTPSSFSSPSPPPQLIKSKCGSNSVYSSIEKLLASSKTNLSRLNVVSSPKDFSHISISQHPDHKGNVFRAVI